MSEHIQTTGRLWGNALLLASMFAQWLVDHGLSNAMVWIALMGLFFNVFTGLPAIANSCRLIREWLERK
jgi:hypothetical protein